MKLLGNMNNFRFIFTFICTICIFSFFSCNENKEYNNKQQEVKKKLPSLRIPDFNEDSAYYYVKKQVSFGPRVPNTENHEKCKKWIVKKLKSFNFNVIEQKTKVKAFNNKILNITNIIGEYNKIQVKNRIVLFAHWDTRPFADRDLIRQNQAIDGANDGASGVAVLLELARQINIKRPETGIDIIFLDAEDYGQPNQSFVQQKSNTWCLGSQYWSKNPHKKNYQAKFGILLDMVGAADAVFPMEGTSMQYAPEIVSKIWNIALRLGYSKYFVFKKTPVTIDDHLYINKYAKIPTIDIVHYNPYLNDYGSFHHRHSDNMDIISKKTLKVVGTTLLATIFLEEKEL